ncbi:hypothetical protein BBP40_011672 [Aspergillus hancockii]|nr:hypothetical protein BBP40_011672 [Aspergillus hancockii]
MTSFADCTPCYDDSAEPIPSLSVPACPKEDESRDNWFQAAREIHQPLLNRGLDVTVDILDRRLLQGPNIHLCKATDAIFGKWDDVRKRITQSVDVSGFRLIGCYRMGYDRGSANCKPTVLVTVNPTIARDWKIAEQDIRDILTVGFGLSEVELLIYKDGDIFCAHQPSIESELESSHPADARHCPTVCDHGTLCGPP